VSAGHADDGELMRLLDGESSAEERARLEHHVATCRVCAARRETLGRLGGAVTAALATGDATGLSVRGRSRPLPRAALRAAAVLLVLTGGVAVASAQPVRAWLRERWADLRGIVMPRTGTGEAPRTELSDATTVRFVPTATVFTIELAAHQDGGVLTIEVSADSMAAARVRPGTRGEELIVLPAGLRIANRPDGKASYDVRLPRSVAEVRLRIAGAPERRLVPTPDGHLWTIVLGERER
jgi:putative zinc finger protein